MRCISCGFVNKIGSAVCANCGRELPRTVDRPLSDYLAASNVQAELDTLPDWLNSAPPAPPLPTLSANSAAMPATPPIPKARSANASPSPAPRMVVPRERVDVDGLVTARPVTSPAPAEFGEAEFTTGGTRKGRPLAASEFICPRCKKLKRTNSSMVITDKAGTRRVCYECAYEVRQNAAYLHRAERIHALNGFASGVAISLVCGFILLAIAYLTGTLWLQASIVIGFVIGTSVRGGSGNRHGREIYWAGLAASLVGFLVCVYLSHIGLMRLQSWSLDEVGRSLQRAPLGWQDYLSMLLGLGVAVITAGGLPYRRD